MDIIIFGGQSNMQGQSECLSSEETVPGAFEYKWIGNKLVPLKNPVGENIRYDGSAGFGIEKEHADIPGWVKEHGLGASCFGNTNLVPAFCRAYLDAKHGSVEQADATEQDSQARAESAKCVEVQDGAEMCVDAQDEFAKCGRSIAAQTEIIAVHAAKGSTRISEWLPGTKGYELLVGKAKAAIALVQSEASKASYAAGEYGNSMQDLTKASGKASHAEHIYFVWLQGESDAIAAVKKENYKVHLCTLFTALQADLGVEKFGVIRVGRFTEDERDWEIIHAQSEICKEKPDFVMLTEIATELNTQAEYMNPEYHGHYSAAGLEKLGAVAGRTLGYIAKEY